MTIDEDGTERVFEKKDIALIRLAIEFRLLLKSREDKKKKMNRELMEALDILEKEKNISKDTLLGGN